MAEPTRPHLLVEPWQGTSPADSAPSLLSRIHLLLPARVQRVIDADTEESLPRIGDHTDERRFDWRAFELPVVATPAASTLIDLLLMDEAGRWQPLPITHPNTSRPESVPTDPRRDAQGDADARSFLESYVQTIAQLTHIADVQDQSDACRDDSPDPTIAWRLHAAIRALTSRAISTDAPVASPPSAILQVAQSLTARLRRERTSTRRPWPPHQARPQQTTATRRAARRLDNALLAAGVDQPGVSTPAERYPVAPVVMRSLELIRTRALTASQNQSDQNHTLTALIHAIDATGAHGRCRNARHPSPHTFQPRTRQLIERSAWRLLTEQTYLDQAWRWRHRVWVEACQWAVWAALETLAPANVAGTSRIFIRAAPHAGRWVDPRTAIGPWEWRAADREVSLLAIDGRQLAAYAAVAPFTLELIALRPDAVLICRDRAKPDAPPPRIICIWCILDQDPAHDRLAARCNHVDNRLKIIRSPSDLIGVIIQPDFTTPSPRQTTQTQRCRGLRAPLKPWADPNALASLLKEAIA